VYSPSVLNVPGPFTLRPLTSTSAIGYSTPNWEGREDFLDLHGQLGASLLDGHTKSIIPISSLDGSLVSNLVILNKDTFLAQVGTPGKEKLVYGSLSGALREIGKCSELGIDLSPWNDARGGDLEVFPDDNGHSFVIRATDFAFGFDTTGTSQPTVLAKRYEIGTNRVIEPPIVLDSGGYLWVVNYAQGTPRRGISVWDRRKGAEINSVRPFFEMELDLPHIVPFGDGQHALACLTGGDNGLYFIDLKAAPPNPRLKLGASDLSVDSLPKTQIAFDPNNQTPQFSFATKTAAGRPDALAKIQVIVTEEGTGHQRKWETPPLTGGWDNYLLHPAIAGQESDPKAHIEYGRPCTVQATLSDPLGSQVSWSWKDIVFEDPRPLLARPWFRSVLAFFSICLIAFVVTLLSGSAHTVARLAVYILAVGTPWLGKDFFQLDQMVLAGLLIVTLLGGAVSGLLSPSLFRVLEPIDPFRPFAGLAASIPSVRRKLFAAYSMRVLDRLDREREKANREKYTPLPIKVKEQRNANLEPAAPSLAAVQLCRKLSARQNNDCVHVLLEAPGGRGKSALLREIVKLAMEKWEADPRCQIPVFCDGEQSTLFDRASESLGRDGFSKQLLRTLAESGTFFFVVDGLSESSVTPKILREQVAAFDKSVPMLMSSRPTEIYRNAIQQAASAWIVVEPARLTDATLGDFVRVYGNSVDILSAEVKAACMDEDGTYLPILIRLALLAGGTGIRSIRDIYAGEVNQILVKKGIDLNSLVQLCLDTYWNTGNRWLEYANASQTQKPLLDALIGADLVVPAELNPADPGNPHTVRFFHDSIQSYLTAVGLMRATDWREKLLVAAGDPRFDADETGVTELFLMCLYTAQNQLTFRRHLLESLVHFSTNFAGAFSRDWVIELARLQGLSERIPSEIAGGQALANAAQECFATPDIRYLGGL
jgi:hypothetical protein